MTSRAVHYQAGTHLGAFPVLACRADMLAVPQVTPIPDHVTCGSCRRTRAWRAAYAAATGGTA